MKTNTSIYIDEDIVKYCKENDISLSSWVDKEFKKAHFGENIDKNILDFQYKIAELERLKAKKSEKLLDLSIDLREKLEKCAEKYRAGYSFEAILRRFNSENGQNVSKKQFLHFIETQKVAK